MATIITKNSNTVGVTPSTLEQGELAINVADGKLFYGNGTAVQEYVAVSASYSTTGSFATTASYALSYTETDPVYAAASANIAFINQSNTFQTGQVINGSLSLNHIGYTSHRIDTVFTTASRNATTDILQVDMDGVNSPAIHMKYCLYSTSPVNARTGTFMLVTDVANLLGNGSTVNYTETTTTDIGDTSQLTIQAIQGPGSPTNVFVQVINNTSNDYYIRFEYTIL